MRFIDYNGSGGLDPQDIATSVAVEEATREDAADEKETPAQHLSQNAGCATMAALATIAAILALNIISAL